MCGIAGYFGQRPPSDERVEDCLRLMRRRGPDHAAHRLWKTPSGRQAVFLHSRLNIIDLDPRANQPFHVGSRWLSYNGETYNYLELKREMEALGRKFATTSDTEVLLHAIDLWGLEQALDRCEGMWAFAVFNEADGSLALSRDRFGEKPLYTFRDAEGFYFGSEVKFIAALLGRKLSVNYQHLYRFLVNGYKSLYKTRETFFQGVEELPPGTILQVDSEGRISQRRYWTPRFAPDDQMSYEQAVAGARERVLRSVERRLRADVPLAFCMSGGVDSNALISAAKNVFRYDVHGFTITNSDARYDEEALVERAVRELGIRHVSIPVRTDDFLPRLRELVIQHDAPVYTIAYFAHWLLMRSIADHGYRVSVSGTGADELFSGYYDHHLAYLHEVRGEPALHAASREAWSAHVRPVVRNPYLSDPDLFTRDPRFRGHIFLRAEEFARMLRRPFNEPFTEEFYTHDLLRNRMFNEMFHEAVPVILHEDDLNAMYYSIENRSPFLDRALFEFCNTIPTRHLVRDGRAKAVLRDAMKGVAPAFILDNRRKVGFNAPILDFLDVANPKVRARLLEDGPIFDHLRREAIRDLLSKPQLPNSESKLLFYFLTSKLFVEAFG